MTSRTYFTFIDRPKPLVFVVTDAKTRRQLRREGWERVRVAEADPRFRRWMQALPADGLAHEFPGYDTLIDHTHYHVISGMPGSMPNANDYAATRTDALALLKWWRDTLDEDNWQRNEHETDPDYKRRRSGSLRAGEFRWNSRSPYDLGYYVQITRCDEADCGPHGDGW